MSRPKKRRALNGRISFVIIVLFLVVVMTVAMIILIRKDLALKDVEAKKMAELEKEVSQELSDKERYTQTSEYVENTAKNKLGLVKEDEIIFREK